MRLLGSIVKVIITVGSIVAALTIWEKRQAKENSCEVIQ